MQFVILLSDVKTRENNNLLLLVTFFQIKKNNQAYRVFFLLIYLQLYPLLLFLFSSSNLMFQNFSSYFLVIEEK